MNTVAKSEYTSHGSLSSLALGDDAFNLVEPAICAWSTVLDDIATDLACSTTLAGLRGSTLHWTETLAVEVSGDGGRSLLSCSGSVGVGTGVYSGGTGHGWVTLSSMFRPCPVGIATTMTATEILHDVFRREWGKRARRREIRGEMHVYRWRG